MSHELRRALNAIMGVFGNPQPRDDGAACGQRVQALLGRHPQLGALSARPDRRHPRFVPHRDGTPGLAEEAVDIAAVAGECARLFQARADERRHALLFDVPGDCPRLIGDRRALRQILLNLVSNAIKFTPAGGTIRVAAAVDDGERLVLSVKDTGPGIPAHELDGAVAAFARGALATRRAIDGAGLGLPIVKGLVKLHEGELAIRSMDGAGTIVLVIFPRRRVLIGAALSASQSSAIASESQRRLIALTA
jgi:two-component system cell cycle sensor histidine kinase PleC